MQLNHLGENNVGENGWRESVRNGVIRNISASAEKIFGASIKAQRYAQ
jgi:hypothetical protein